MSEQDEKRLVDKIINHELAQEVPIKYMAMMLEAVRDALREMEVENELWKL